MLTNSQSKTQFTSISAIGKTPLATFTAKVDVDGKLSFTIDNITQSYFDCLDTVNTDFSEFQSNIINQLLPKTEKKEEE